MNKIQRTIWGRKLSLNVYFEQFKGENITSLQKEAYECFVNDKDICEVSLETLKSYICKNYGESIPDNEITNIFKYVIPKTVYIPQEQKKTIALLCDFKFDLEHGIALVYENEKLKEIASQDDVL